MARQILNWFSGLVFSLCLLAALLLAGLLYAPFSPLPAALNPLKPLDPKAPLNFVTPMKLRFSIADPQQCLKALSDLDVIFEKQPDKLQSNICHIENRVEVRQLSTSRINTLDTTCGTALRLAMWEYHVVQPEAKKAFGKEITKLQQIGSFSCRRIRTSSGTSEKMSEHATANAVDISAFEAAGLKFNLIEGWDAPDTSEFLTELRDGACDFFRVVLSPEFNALHADHFHFDQGRWTSCR